MCWPHRTMFRDGCLSLVGPWTSRSLKTQAQYKSNNHLTGGWRREAVTPNWGFWGNLGFLIRMNLSVRLGTLCQISLMSQRPNRHCQILIQTKR